MISARRATTPCRASPARPARMPRCRAMMSRRASHVARPAVDDDRFRRARRPRSPLRRAGWRMARSRRADLRRRDRAALAKPEKTVRRTGRPHSVEARLHVLIADDGDFRVRAPRRWRESRSPATGAGRTARRAPPLSSRFCAMIALSEPTIPCADVNGVIGGVAQFDAGFVQHPFAQRSRASACAGAVRD